ncbi:hypothetical protein [[Clostridium] polysaccharolyticum]|jgi:hypothetical protein|uniref:Uncharacterized protein n=1 Tax=[Clostridium] polysaccharolyticum TaxID=29364 RepID=A0A1H9Y0Z0_9FIRM|nr:hypothetical protein [[Clostridium] polysaccharolyticum]SES61895.1 hypothetical protein SAMN04487772_1015 [[Clostridium] polysaccharolyticum]
MKKIEKAIAKVARHYADKSVNQLTCTFWWYQLKVTEQLKTRLKETRKKA